MRHFPLVVLALALTLGFGCSRDQDPPIGKEGFLLVEQCTCDGGGPILFSDPNLYLGKKGEQVACDGGIHGTHDMSDGTSCPAGGQCTPDCRNTGGEDDCGGSQPPAAGGCWVTGGGFISDGLDTFGGNGMSMKSGDVRGEWEHQDHGTATKTHGQVRYLVCRRVAGPGPGQPSGPSHNFDINQVYFGGPARWFTGGAWKDGYWFDVMAEDHGEPGGQDYYHFTVRQMVAGNQSGPIVHDVQGGLGGGNVQIHPSNNGHPYAGGTLPPWVQLQP